MSRVDALRKLLALGDLHPSEIYAAMGGDREAAEDALAELTKSGDVYRIGASYGVPVFRLSKPARARAFVVDLLPPERNSVRVSAVEIQVFNFTEPA